jgi:hypothetical protein
MVSETNEQRSQRHGKENEDLCPFKVVVECRDQRKKKDRRQRDKEKMPLRGSCWGEGRPSEVDPVVLENNVGQLLAESSGSKGVKSRAIGGPSCRHDRCGLVRQRWQANKHIIGERGDAEAQILSPEGW